MGSGTNGGEEGIMSALEELKRRLELVEAERKRRRPNEVDTTVIDALAIAPDTRTVERVAAYREAIELLEREAEEYVPYLTEIGEVPGYGCGNFVVSNVECRYRNRKHEHEALYVRKPKAVFEPGSRVKSRLGDQGTVVGHPSTGGKPFVRVVFDRDLLHVVEVYTAQLTLLKEES
jgi:hypothetical protein